jgi:biotin synthase-related radical SAM superfamily protein
MTTVISSMMVFPKILKAGPLRTKSARCCSRPTGNTLKEYRRAAF